MDQQARLVSYINLTSERVVHWLSMTDLCIFTCVNYTDMYSINLTRRMHNVVYCLIAFVLKTNVYGKRITYLGVH